MKKVKKLVCFVLAFLVAMSMGQLACAAENASDYLRAYVAYCYYDGDGTVSVWYEIEGVNLVPYLGVLSIDLQEQVAGTGDWDTVLYVTNFTDESLLSQNDDFHYGHVDYDEAVEGRLYRALVTFWGGEAEVGDSRQYTTETIVATP